VSNHGSGKSGALHLTGANSDKEKLTAMVIDAMVAGYRRRDGSDCGNYPGGPSALLSDMLIAWGVPASPDTLKNIACKGRK